ncbi:hypothetical protein AVEN_227435-1, partial [Araneus ventricosus]
LLKEIPLTSTNHRSLLQENQSNSNHLSYQFSKPIILALAPINPKPTNQPIKTKKKTPKLGEGHSKNFEKPKRMDCCPKQQRNHQQRDPATLIPITTIPTGNS